MWHWRDIFTGASNLQSQNAIGQEGLLIGRQNLLRLDSKPLEKKIDLDDWMNSKKVLLDIGKKIAQDNGRKISEMFFYEEVKPYVPLYTPDNPPT